MAKGLKSFTRFIIVDEKSKPLAWCGDQLCYCSDEDWQDDHNPVKTYTERTARKHIANTIKFRNSHGFETGRYRLMPIKL